MPIFDAPSVPIDTQLLQPFTRRDIYTVWYRSSTQNEIKEEKDR